MRHGGHGPCGIIFSLVEQTVGVANGLSKYSWVRSVTASPVARLEYLCAGLREMPAMFRASTIFLLKHGKFSKVAGVQFATYADHFTAHQCTAISF